MSIKNEEELIKLMIQEMKIKCNKNLGEIEDIIKVWISENKYNNKNEKDYEQILETWKEILNQEKTKQKSEISKYIELLEEQYINRVIECQEIIELYKILSNLELNNKNILEYLTPENLQILSKMIHSRINSQSQIEQYLGKIIKKIDKDSDLYYEILALINQKYPVKEIHYLYELERITEFISKTSNPLNQLQRIQYNIKNYNTFTCIMLTLLTNDYKYISQIGDNIDVFLLSISSFILGMQYDNSARDISNEYFSTKVRESLYTAKPNSIVSISQIIRNAISHGEYYLYNKNGIQHIKIENSGRIGKKFELEISYDEFIKHIKENYLVNFKENYPNFSPLTSIMESGIRYETLKLERKNFILSLLALNAFNIIEYNLQHHFKKIRNIDEFTDISNFKFECSENSKYYEKNITVYELLENIKNAIGHGNVKYNEQTEELEFNNTNPHKNPPQWVSTSKIKVINLLKFFSNNFLYDMSTQTTDRINYETSMSNFINITTYNK